jgi:hypothetical protein
MMGERCDFHGAGRDNAKEYCVRKPRYFHATNLSALDQLPRERSSTAKSIVPTCMSTATADDANGAQ